MVAILVALFRLLLKPAMVDQARRKAERGLRGKMEGHAEMDMAVAEGPIIRRILSDSGKTAISTSSWIGCRCGKILRVGC